MKSMSLALALGLVLASSQVLAADPATAGATPQQNKMKMCNADAKSKALQGDERKAFMKTCLSNKPVAEGGGTTQQNKMKACNADAKTKALQGDERKAFMKTCLKG